MSFGDYMKRRRNNIAYEICVISNLFADFIIQHPPFLELLLRIADCHRFAVILISMYVYVQYYDIYVDIPAILHTEIYIYIYLRDMSFFNREI